MENTNVIHFYTLQNKPSKMAYQRYPTSLMTNEKFFMFQVPCNNSSCFRMALKIGWMMLLTIILLQEQEVWDGYQCGYCGKEFKTQSELQCHQFSQHTNIWRKRNLQSIFLRFTMISFLVNWNIKLIIYMKRLVCVRYHYRFQWRDCFELYVILVLWLL